MRFDFDVSPPPPPPIELSALQALVDDDPETFVEVRRQLETWFPRLSHVATSSVGASVGPFIAAEVVTPMQLTKATLASYGMKPDSLGARVVESRHTGRWRAACSEMFHFFGTHLSPGRDSEAVRSGYEEQHVTHAGQWDRNAFVAAMLEIKLSFNGHPLDQVEFSPLQLYDRICGGAPNQILSEREHTEGGPAGYRVPTSTNWDANSATYGDLGTPLTDFAPILTYGSLETLRSMASSALSSCNVATARDDALVQLFCQQQEAFLSTALVDQSTRSPFTMQRDVFCNPHEQISIEEAIGDPEFFTEALLDTEIKSRYRLNDLVVPAVSRGPEKIHLRKSIRSWVLVTSSGDASVRAGMYRLQDLPVFRDMACDELPNVQCSNEITTAMETVALPFATPPALVEFWTGGGGTSVQEREVETPRLVHLNAQAGLADGLAGSAQWVNGKELLPLVRCSTTVANAIGVSCRAAPYAAHVSAGCTADSLVLRSAPTTYGAAHWVSRLRAAPSPSPPPPPPTPHPPPAPPLPFSPPPPPRVQSQLEVMQQIRLAEERFCTTVYFLSSATRCERLALELTESVLMRFISPPSPPPFSYPLTNPPPPSPSPTPSLPEDIHALDAAGARLSTFRLPDEPPGGVVDQDLYFVENATTLRAQLGSLPIEKWACVPGAPLACASGVLAQQCQNGNRRCGTSYENALDPFLEVDFVRQMGYYVWAVELTLPESAQLAALARGDIQISLFGPRNVPVPCAHTTTRITQTRPSDVILFNCAPVGSTTDQLLALSTVTSARIMLVGDFRQIWFSQIRLLVRALTAADVTASMPPPPPISPPLPPTSPPISCSSTPGSIQEADVDHLEDGYGCGVSFIECCAEMQERNATGFTHGAAGCCRLFWLSPGIGVASVVQEGNGVNEVVGF